MTTHIEALPTTPHELLTEQDQSTILSQLTDQELREGERRALIHHLISATPEQRAEVTLIEIDHIASICRGRVIERTEADGSHSTYFATRDTSGQSARLDDIYRLTQRPDGTTTFQVDFLRSDQYGYRITGDESGKVAASVLMPGYIKGIAAGSDSDERFFEDYMDRSLKTARIMKERRKHDPEAAMEADARAKELLQAYLDAYSDAA
jgi:hypothetical protein